MVENSRGVKSHRQAQADAHSGSGFKETNSLNGLLAYQFLSPAIHGRGSGVILPPSICPAQIKGQQLTQTQPEA